MLALFFAASWCPGCTDVTPVVDRLLQDHGNDSSFELMYVSSDNTNEQLEAYVPSDKWGIIPFEDEEARSNLKRHFGACASKETESLGMSSEDRKSGLPTLILLEKASGKILTRNGVDDITAQNGSNGAAVVQKWKDMMSS